MTRFERQATGPSSVALLVVWLLIGFVAFAQDEPVPKPKSKPATSASKPAAKAAPSSGATLLVMCDLACSWRLDGKALGRLAADDSTTVAVSLGQHIVTAATADGKDTVRQNIQIESKQQALIELKLAPVRALRLQQERQTTEAQRGYWIDANTGLMWTIKDNGKDLDWNQATSHCKNLRLAGYGDWRLPTDDELKDIHDETFSIPGSCCDGRSVNWHVKGNLQPSGIEWSGSRGTSASSDAGSYDFNGVGDRSKYAPTFTLYMRALCVRHSGD